MLIKFLSLVLFNMVVGLLPTTKRYYSDVRLPEPPTKAPNIILIIGDGTGPGYGGNERYRSTDEF